MTDKEVKCAGCGVTVAADSRFCGACGRALRTAEPAAPTEAKCPACGAAVDARSKYCHDCGAAVVVPGKEVRETGADAATKGDEPKSVVTHPEAAPEKRAVPADDRGEARVPMDGEACGVLRIVSEEHFGREFHITGEVLRIGKEVSADISLPDDTFTSHAHARLLVRGADVEIEDLGSRNGTFIQVRDRECLKNGDRLLIGATVLEYRAARCRME